MLDLLNYVNSTDKNYSTVTSTTPIYPKVNSNARPVSPPGKVRTGEKFQFDANPIDYNDEHSWEDCSSQVISPSKNHISSLNPNAKPFVPNIWNGNGLTNISLFYESSLSSVSSASTKSSNSNEHYTFRVSAI